MSRIKGITLEIGGETTGLQNALKDVNKRSNDLAKELRDVEKLLKFNPGNVDLLAQKQTLLNERIATTSEKLDQLKAAQSQVEAQFQSGQIGIEQYRAFQRELITTEGSLNGLRNNLQRLTDEQQSVQQSTRQLETLFQATGTSIDQFADALGTQLTNAIREGRGSSQQLEQAIDQIGQAALGADVDLNRMRDALRSVDNGASLDQVRADLADVTQEANQAGDAVNGFGQKLSSVAGALAAGGGIAVAIQQALDVSSLDTKIDITFDVPESSQESVRQAIRGIETYGLDTQEALEGVRRQWALNKDASDEANEAIVKGAAVIAANYNQIDFTELIQETNEIASELKIADEAALAMVNSLLRMGFPPEQLDIISEYGQQLERAGYSAEEIQAIMAAGVETGTWNIDNLLDGLKEGRIQMASFASAMDKNKVALVESSEIGMAQFDKWAIAIAEGGEKGSQAMVEIATMLDQMTDQVMKNDLGTMIFGTKFEDQGQNIIDTILNASNATVDFAENQQQLNDSINKMDEDPAVQLKEALTNMKTELTPLLTQVAEFVGEIASWAAENPKLMATIAGVGTAVGILVGAFATLMPAIGSVVGLLGGAGGAVALFSGALAVLTGPIGLTVAAVAAIGVTAYKVGQELGEASIQIDLFGQGVSESTAKAVGGFLQLEEQATLSLNQLNWSGQSVTTEMAAKITDTFNQMGDQVLSAMQEDHSAQLQTMQDHFSNSSALTEAEESAIIAKMQEKQAEQSLVIEDGKKRIAQILETAAGENRRLTELEQKEINAIQHNMTKNAVQYMSDSEREQKVILERLKSESSKITAEQAAEVVKNSVKQKNEVVKEANDQYNKSVAEIIKQRDEMGTITKEQADKLIQEAGRQKTDTIHSAEEMHKSVVKEAQAQANEHVDKVNWETGEVKSKWEVMKSDVSKKMTELGSNIKKGWNDALSDTRSKVEEIKSTASEKFAQLKKSVGEKMEQVKGEIEDKWNKAEQFLESISLVSIGKNIIQGLIDGITNMASRVTDAISNISEGILSTAERILEIFSPSRAMRRVGEYVGEGLALGIEDSGSLVVAASAGVTNDVLDTFATLPKEIGGYTKDALYSLNTFQEQWSKIFNNPNPSTTADILKMADLMGAASVYLDENSKKVFDIFGEASKSLAYSELVKLATEYNAKLKELGEERIAQEKALLAEYEKALSDRTNELRKFAGIFDSVKLKEDVTGKALTDSLQSQVDALELYSSGIQTLIDRGFNENILNEFKQLGVKSAKEIQAIASMSDEELSQYVAIWEEKNKLAREAAEIELAYMKEDMEEQLEAINTEADKKLQEYALLYETNIDKLSKFVRTEFVDLKNEMVGAGANTVDGLIQGMQSKQGQLIAVAQSMADAVSSTFQNALDIHSPSRVFKGFGININEGLIQGIKESSTKLNNAMNNVYGSLANSAKSMMYGSSNSYSTNTNDYSRKMTNHITISSSSNATRDMERTLRRLAFEF